MSNKVLITNSQKSVNKEIPMVMIVRLKKVKRDSLK